MNNTRYTECQNIQDNTYCKIVIDIVGDLPQENIYIYDIAYFMYFIAFIIVILSPIYILYKLINGTRKGH